VYHTQTVGMSFFTRLAKNMEKHAAAEAVRLRKRSYPRLMGAAIGILILLALWIVYRR
jgi:hypothetical protein